MQAVKSQSIRTVQYCTVPEKPRKTGDSLVPCLGLPFSRVGKPGNGSSNGFSRHEAAAKILFSLSLSLSRPKQELLTEIFPVQVWTAAVTSSFHHAVGPLQRGVIVSSSPPRRKSPLAMR